MFTSSRAFLKKWASVYVYQHLNTSLIKICFYFPPATVGNRVIAVLLADWYLIVMYTCHTHWRRMSDHSLINSHIPSQLISLYFKYFKIKNKEVTTEIYIYIYIPRKNKKCFVLGSWEEKGFRNTRYSSLLLD